MVNTELPTNEILKVFICIFVGTIGVICDKRHMMWAWRPKIPSGFDIN
jgi:hypothetical protein